MAEMPELVRLQEEYRERGLRVALVSLDLITPGGKDSAEKVQAFLDDRQVALDAVVYRDAFETLQSTWGLGNGLPYSVTIAQDGSVLQGITGAASHERFASMIEEALDR